MTENKDEIENAIRLLATAINALNKYGRFKFSPEFQKELDRIRKDGRLRVRSSKKGKG